MKTKDELADEYIAALHFEIGQLKLATADVHGRSKQIAASLLMPENHNPERLRLLAGGVEGLAYENAHKIQSAQVARIDAQKLYREKRQEEQLFAV